MQVKKQEYKTKYKNEWFYECKRDIHWQYDIRSVHLTYLSDEEYGEGNGTTYIFA